MFNFGSLLFWFAKCHFELQLPVSMMKRLRKESSVEKMAYFAMAVPARAAIGRCLKTGRRFVDEDRGGGIPRELTRGA